MDNMGRNAEQDRMESRLSAILNYYRTIEILHPVVNQLSDEPGFMESFYNCLKYELLVTDIRSQDLADHEISIFQKALGTLMLDENDLTGGVELYIDEILGLKLLKEAQKSEILKSIIVARNAFIEGLIWI